MLSIQLNSIDAMATSTKESVPTDIKIQEGAALRRLLEDRKIAHQQLAEDSQIGTKAYVSQLINGHRPLNIEVAARVASMLGVRIDEFSPRLADIVRSAYEHVGRDNYPAFAGYHEVNEPRAFRLGAASTHDKSNAPWPFAMLTPAQYGEISEGGRQELEQLARGMYMEAHRTAKVSGG